MTLRTRMTALSLAAVLIVGELAAIDLKRASADTFGCEVLLCAGQNWQAIAACIPPMTAALQIVHDGGRWPTCPEANNAGQPGGALDPTLGNAINTGAGTATSAQSNAATQAITPAPNTGQVANPETSETKMAPSPTPSESASTTSQSPSP